MLAGDIPAECLVRNMNFQVYLKMYCQGTKFGCPDAALLGICAIDLIHPSTVLTRWYQLPRRGDKKRHRAASLERVGFHMRTRLFLRKVACKD